MSDDKITYGKFVTKKKTRPAAVVDCSGWADPADGPITYGKFVTKKKTRPAIVVDCSDWGHGLTESVETSPTPDGNEPRPDESGIAEATLAKHLLATYKALNEYALAKSRRHLSRDEFRRLVFEHAGVLA